MSTTVNIVKTPDTLHGKPRIEGTRIGVLEVGELVREEGWSIEEVTDQFDLEREQIEAALRYYDEHPEVIDTLRVQREANRRRIRERSRTNEK